MPSSVNGIPVENSGSMNAAADGSIAHPGPAAHRARHDEPRHPRELAVGSLAANCAAMDG